MLGPWLKAVAAFHECVMRFLQLGHFVRSGRVLWRNLEVAGGSWRYQQREREGNAALGENYSSFCKETREF